MVLCALDVQNIFLGYVWSVALTNTSSQLENLLLSDRDGIGIVKAAQINMLCGVIFVIDLVKNLPCDIKLDSLPNELNMVPVISLRYRFFSELHLGPNLVVKICLGLLHLGVEYLVVLIAYPLVPLLLLLVGDAHGSVPSWRAILFARNVLLSLFHIINVRVLGDGGCVPAEGNWFHLLRLLSDIFHRG